MSLAPRVVIVHRRSELQELTERHSTQRQVEFFLQMRGLSIESAEESDQALQDATKAVGLSLPADWRRAEVERADLPRFIFGPEDIIAVVGQDGLVANVAKYLTDQPVVGFNPFPDSNAGVLTPFNPEHSAQVLAGIATGRARFHQRVMAHVEVDDGQTLVALNDIYLGHTGHQSARYTLETPDGMEENHSSSGVIVGTGTGATGWLRSLANDRELDALLPGPTDHALAWFVREAWPSPFTQATLTSGRLDNEQHLTITVQSESLVVFGDGIEADRLDVGHGQRVQLGVASRRLRTVAAV